MEVVLRQRRRELARPVCVLVGLACGDGVDGTNVWTTHVVSDPPLAALVFWLLARVELGGGSWHVGIVANSGLALLRGREARWALAAAAGWAILVNHLFNTGW